MFHSKFVLAAIVAVSLAPSAQAYFGGPGQQVQVKKSQTSGKSFYGYYEYLPQDYSETSGKKSPVVLFLHGLGEQGNGEGDLYKVAVHGPSKVVAQGKQLPALVFSPQSAGWWNADAINSFVNYIYANYPGADPKRLYVTGLSMGGGGTWDFTSKYPERVAAIVPICGAGDITANFQKFYGKGVWVFHAFDDSTVGLAKSTYNIDKMTPASTSIMTGYPYKDGYTNRAASTDMIALYSMSRNTHQWYTGATTSDLNHDTIRFTVYRTGGHDSWTRTYANNEMWNWLFTWTNEGVVVPVPSPTPSPKPTPTPTPTITPPPSAATFSSGSLTVDFGSDGSLTSKINNFGDGVVAGGTVSKLSKDDQQVTTAVLAIVRGFNGVNQNGNGTDGAGFVSMSTKDSYFGNDVLFNGTTAPLAQLELSGLDPSKVYDFTFFASRMGAGGDNRETEYRVSGVNAGVSYLNVAENKAQAASVKGIQPGGNGKILLDVKKGPRNNNAYGFFYLGAMKVVARSAEAAQQEVRVDFGNNGPALPAGWNNGRGLVASGSVALKNTAGALLPYDLSTITRFNNVNANGTPAPAAALTLPKEAAFDSFFGNDVMFGGMVAPKAVLEIRDLDPSKAYSFEFFASRMAGDGLKRETLYRVIGASTVSATLDATDNVSRSAIASNVKPNASGVIRIEVQKGSSNNVPYGFYYLGSLKIRF